VQLGSALDPVDSVSDHPASSFSPNAQPFTPKTGNAMLSAVTGEPVVSRKTPSFILSPDAPEFVPKNFKPPVKVLSFDYIKCCDLM